MSAMPISINISPPFIEAAEKGKRYHYLWKHYLGENHLGYYHAWHHHHWGRYHHLGKHHRFAANQDGSGKNR
jgi:hypothetical protein